MDYLHDEQYYIDRYDLLTINDCLRRIKIIKEVYTKSLTDEKFKAASEDDRIKTFNHLLYWELFTVKTREYIHKKETIQKWITADSIEQNKYDSTPMPQGVHCSECGFEMKNTSKHLDNYSDKPIRILFFFECLSCKKRKGIYEDGEERVSTPEKCPKCKKEIHTKTTRNGNVITWTKHCKVCGFIEIETDDMDKSTLEWNKKKEADTQLLQKYREEFCLTDEEGKEHIEMLEALDVASEVYEEELQKYDSLAYQTTTQLKKITFVDLETLLSETLEKELYIKLSFEKPEIGQFIVLPFCVQDANSTRNNKVSIYDLQKLLKNTLSNTNWRLMSDGLSYRLGYITGRLKGYEHDEDLMEISGEKKQAKKSSITPEKRMKYTSHSMVQLSRLSGKFDGIKNVRKRRLEKEPEGFFLELSEGPLTCGICSETSPGNTTWWTKDDICCADCWRNIQEGSVPNILGKKDDVWIRDRDFKSNYSIQSITRRKLEHEGKLHKREMKRKDGHTYCTIYLLDENKEFFKNNPKKPEREIQLQWSQEKKSLLLSSRKIDYSK